MLLAPNALSNCGTGESYAGRGCFPLGHHLTYSEFSDLVKSLRRLRQTKMLRPLSESTMEDVRSQLRPLTVARTFWSHPRDAREAQAIGELLDCLFPAQPSAPSQPLEIYTFPDSVLLSSSGIQIWGLFERDVHSKKTILYISGKQKNVGGVVLHTFLSIRMCPRLQCFLAEYVLAAQAKRLTKEWNIPERFQSDMDLLTDKEKKRLLKRLEDESSLAAPILCAKLTAYLEDQLQKDKD